MDINEFSTTYTDAAVLPSSIEAEQAVLGAILVEPECINRILELVRPDYFFNEQNREIFAAVHSLYRTGTPIDLVTVLNELVGVGLFAEDYGKQYLFSLAQAVPSLSNIEAYARILREKYELRALILAARSIISDACDDANSVTSVLDRAEQRIYEIANTRSTQGLVPLQEVMMTAYENLVLKSGEDTREQFVGTPTGISELDRTISGLNKTDLIILAARPGMGKTSFALNIARNVATSAKRKVAFFSLEMTREQLALRLLSSESGISGHKLRDGVVSDDEWFSIAHAANQLHNVPIFLDEAGNITVTEMKAKLRREGDVGLVIIDYLQLMSTGGSTNRVQEVSDITRQLKIMAKELNVPVICLSQLNRSAESRQGHKPMMADLRDSGSIEQDADIVLFLYRPGYYAESDDGKGGKPPEEVNQNVAVCIVAKNRHGETGDIPLHWSGETTRFTSLATNSEK